MLLLLVIAGLAACGPSQEELQQSQRLTEIHKVVVRHFGSEIIAGTWGRWPVASVSKRSTGRVNVVEVTVDVPTAQANDITSRSSEGQFRAVGWSACPHSNDPLWSSFTVADILEIQARINGQVFIDVDCKRWRLK